MVIYHRYGFGRMWKHPFFWFCGSPTSGITRAQRGNSVRPKAEGSTLSNEKSLHFRDSLINAGCRLLDRVANCDPPTEIPRQPPTCGTSGIKSAHNGYRHHLQVWHVFPAGNDAAHWRCHNVGSDGQAWACTGRRNAVQGRSWDRELLRNLGTRNLVARDPCVPMQCIHLPVDLSAVVTKVQASNLVMKNLNELTHFKQ